MDGRKIPSDIENPFDNVFIYCALKLNTYVFRPLNFTPNIITTLSLISGLAAAYCFHIQYYLLSALFYIISYILDCSDGSFARKYNMVTTFGDWYDHISDYIKHLALFYVILIHPITTHKKIAFFVVLMILVLLLCIHIGCQERYHDEENSLSFLKLACPNKDAINYTKYLGCGTSVIYITLFILFSWFSKHQKTFHRV